MNSTSKITIRVKQEEFGLIRQKADKASLPLSTYCREVLLGHEVNDTLPRQEIGKTMCIYHNKIEDAKTLDETKREAHEMEAKIWRHIK